MCAMSVNSVSTQNTYHYTQPDRSTQQQEKEKSPTIQEMMLEAREKAEAAKEKFKPQKNNTNYGDATIMAYARLGRAKTQAQVNSASAYARRMIAQFKAAKRQDSDNADRIQAAINQLQKAVSRASKKNKELAQEKVMEARRDRLQKEERTREAQRQNHQLRNRQMGRFIRESGYITEAENDNRLQDQLAAAKMELREQAQQLSDSLKADAAAAAQQYASQTSPSPESAPQMSLEA